MPTDLERLLKIIEQKLDWGESGTWQSRDFDNLNQRIFDETGVSLSASTLRRVWGRVEYKHLPSGTTLDTLAKFGGYESWRVFTKTQTISVAPVSNVTEKVPPAFPVHKTPWLKIAAASIIIVAASLTAIFAFKKAPVKAAATAYSFSVNRVSSEIPNSVIFTYDATAAIEDSIYIQQSWDPTTRTAVDKAMHKHSSIYYEPGFYHAKLVVGKNVVKEYPLLIPTGGWLGMISNKPVPIYLEPNEFVHKDSLQMPLAVITKNNIPQEPMLPQIKFYNVGNFTPVPLEDFAFTVDVKNEYKVGSGVCQRAAVALITDQSPIIIPLSALGCVSDLMLLNAGQMVLGKKADLSGFGVDFSNWAQVSCKSSNGNIQYYVNGKLAYEGPQPAKGVKIVGVGFMFQGTGAVKNIHLNSKGTSVFRAF